MSPSGSTDRFLGGRLEIAQVPGYRAGADPVFLAAAVPAAAGQSVLELGCGAGVALFCLGTRVTGLTMAGLERDTAAAELARANARANGLSAEIVTGDLSKMPAPIRDRQYDHVLMNPPFFREGSVSANGARRSARHEETPLAAWIDAALRRLRPGGRLTLLHRTERVPDIFAALDGRAGDVSLRPLAPRAARPAKLVLLSAAKGARAPFRLLPPFVLHAGDSHLADGDDYTAAASAILRDGAAFAD